MERLAFIAFALAVFAYGLFGSPTPDHPAVTEILILFLLAIAVAAGGITKAAFTAPWSKPFLLFLGYGFSVVLLVGVTQGYAVNDILRDLVGFAALAVPVALYGFSNQRILLAAMLFVGTAFAARYIASPDLLSSLLAENLLYLANSPLVAFAATWLLLYGCFQEKRFWVAVLCVALACIPILAMAGMTQRATLALLLLAFIGFFLVTLIKNPRRAVVVACALGAVITVYLPEVTGIFTALLDKARAVGWNARGAEIAALIEAQSQNPLTAIVGAGWGSVFKSPSVGDQWVRFSHSLLSSLWWKTGWLGLILGGIALMALVRDAYARLRHNLILFWSCILPLLPAVFLYGSYKSFCFGLLLLGLARFDWTLGAKNVNQTASHDHANTPPVDTAREPRLSTDAGRDGPPAA